MLADTLQATDVIMAGDVLRVYHSGLPLTESQHAAGRLDELRQNHEDFRAFLKRAPVGNPLVNSCLLYPPADPANAGMLFLASRFGYAPFAGTALMAAATHLMSERASEAADGWYEFNFETAVGIARIGLEIRAGKMVSAKWERDHPRLLAKDLVLDCSDGAKRRVSLVTAGLPYIVVEASELGFSLDDHAKLGPAAAALSGDVARVAPMEKFGIANEYPRFLVMAVERADGESVRTAWVSDAGEVAQSPGGTGALAVFWSLRTEGNSEQTLTVKSPGGEFYCGVAGEKAYVSAVVSVGARHEFYPEAYLPL